MQIAPSEKELYLEERAILQRTQSDRELSLAVKYILLRAVSGTWMTLLLAIGKADLTSSQMKG